MAIVPIILAGGVGTRLWPLSRHHYPKQFHSLVGERTMLVVASGTARLDNRKFKDSFGGKGRMLDAEEVLAVTSHPVGGVCPFGLPAPLPIYCDLSLKQFDEVVPAAGSTNSAVRIPTERLAEITGAEWVDVCQ